MYSYECSYCGDPLCPETCPEANAARVEKEGESKSCYECINGGESPCPKTCPELLGVCKYWDSGFCTNLQSSHGACNPKHCELKEERVVSHYDDVEDAGNVLKPQDVCVTVAGKPVGGYTESRIAILRKPNTLKVSNKYDRTIISKEGVRCTVDVYRVLDAFEVRNPMLQHLAKKALCAGLRGHKDILQDLKDIKQSIEEAIKFEEQRNASD